MREERTRWLRLGRDETLTYVRGCWVVDMVLGK
jgi:hypothetical protein